MLWNDKKWIKMLKLCGINVFFPLTTSSHKCTYFVYFYKCWQLWMAPKMLPCIASKRQLYTLSQVGLHPGATKMFDIVKRIYDPIHCFYWRLNDFPWICSKHSWNSNCSLYVPKTHQTTITICAQDIVQYVHKITVECSWSKTY